MRFIRNIMITVGIAALLAGMCGCSIIPSLELTEEESRVISEYAADVLLKYDKQHRYGLQNVYDKPDALEEEKSQTEEIKEAPLEAPNLVDEVSDMAGEEAMSSESIAAALSIDGCDIRFAGFEVCDVYPNEDSGELLFSMNAAEGNSLVILHFDVTNTSNYDTNINLMDSGIKFRLRANDFEVGQQQTILANDLSQMNESILPGASSDQVLVFETFSDEAASIVTMSIVVKSDSGSQIFDLY